MRETSPGERIVKVSNIKERTIVSREEGELSDYDSSEETYCRTVTRPGLLNDDDDRFSSVTNKRNPWGGIAEKWRYEHGQKESSRDFNKNYTEKVLGKRRVSVKERLGWRSKVEPSMRTRSAEENRDWNVKMKRPRMEMVADMEERKMFGRVQGSSIVHTKLFKDKPAKKREVFDKDSAQLDKKFTVGAVERHNDQLKDSKLSKRFFGASAAKRPRFRGEIQRSVVFGNAGVQESEGWRSSVGRGQAVVSLRKEKESQDLADLENDNGSDLDDDANVLIQVIQSDDNESSGGESERIRKAVAKMEEAKQKEEIRRKQMKLVQKEELSKATRKNKPEKENKRKDDVKEAEKKLMDQVAFEMKVHERMKKLEAAVANKKPLNSKYRKRRSGFEIDLKSNSRLVKKQGRFQRRKEEESSSGDSDTTSSSSSDSSDSDSNSSSSSSEVSVPRKGKRSSFRYSKRKVGKNSSKEKSEKYVCATSTPKKENSKVKETKVEHEEYNNKVVDLKSKLKDYLKKVKNKK